jgi:GNAT superfamily N-acetyltransferase
VQPTSPLRQATTADIPAISRLMLELGYETPAEELKRRLELLLVHGDHLLRVAVDERDEVIGAIHAALRFELTAGAFVEIEAMVVSSAARRTGVGRDLVRGVEAWAAGRNVFAVRVRTQTHREAAAAFYRSLGYTPVKQQTVFAREANELRPSGPVTLPD